MPRTDTHRPAEADPSEYDSVAYYYQGTSNALMRAWEMSGESAKYDRAFRNHATFQGNHARIRSCDHCGAAHAHGVLFLHRPSDELIHVGWICAANTIGRENHLDVERGRIEREAREETARLARLEETAAWREENADVIEWLMGQMKDRGENLHPFLKDMLQAINQWGALSERQLAATRRWMERDAQRQAEAATREQEVEPTTPLETGRRTIEGEIISAKYKMSDYGEQMKMLVRQDDGNKVWGTVPASVWDASLRMDRPGDDLRSRLVGLRVTFTAGVERSNDDEHFGFFKRPTGATVAV